MVKRRTFNKVALTGLVAGLSIPLRVVHARQQDTVLECFRYTKSKYEAVTEGLKQRGDSDPYGMWYEHEYIDWMPFTIGLGRYGRKLAAHFNLVTHLEHTVLIYAESHIPPSLNQAISITDEDLLGNAHTGVLMLDLDEPEAWPLALNWANKMNDQDVYMTVAILCCKDIVTAISHPLTKQLKNHLDTVILQPSCNPKSQTHDIHSALQSARVFLMESGLICLDISDFRNALSGQLVVATSSQAFLEDLPAEITSCRNTLQGQRVNGCVAHWVGGLDVSIIDLDNIRECLLTQFNDGCQAVLAHSFDMSMPNGSPIQLQLLWPLST